MRNNRDRCKHVYILDQEEKRSPCAEVMFTKTQERVKIIECNFFCLKGVYWESKLQKFRPERTKIYEARAE